MITNILNPKKASKMPNFSNKRIALIETALNEYGNREIVGAKHNSEIVKYFQEIGFKQVKDDETAWCSAFVNWVAMKSDCLRSKKLNAKSWLEVGIKTETPRIMDVCIFNRGDVKSWQGHVAFYIKETSNGVWVLGGNQANQVKIEFYPKHKLIEIRDIT